VEDSETDDLEGKRSRGRWSKREEEEETKRKKEGLKYSSEEGARSWKTEADRA
jgi:hypothetical protein